MAQGTHHGEPGLIFADVSLAEAENALLAHGQTIGELRWSKGRRLTKADLAAAAASGLNSITVARLEADDLAENIAAERLAERLSGSGVCAHPAIHGRCNLAATVDGVLDFDCAMVTAVNRRNEALTLGTLRPMSRVAAGDIVATVKVIPYAVAAPLLAAACDDAAAMIVHPLRPMRMALLVTRLAGITDKAMAKTVRITRARIAALGGTMETLPAVTHEVTAVAAALRACDAELILIAGASASVDRSDVVPSAIIAAGGDVIRLGMPVDPGNLLVLGRLGNRPVIGLPGCARSPRHNGFDLVLERLVAGMPVGTDDIAMMGVGGLLPDTERPDPQPR